MKEGRAPYSIQKPLRTTLQCTCCHGAPSARVHHPQGRIPTRYAEGVEGLRFTCQPGCTDCCRVTGYVYLTEEDLRKAAAFLGMRPRVFEAKYVYRTAHLLRLRKPRHAQCHFLEKSGCALHPAKPAQCRIFPFWPELVESRSAWRGVSRYCPGIGQGKLASLQGVLRLSAEMREAYPGMYS